MYTTKKINDNSYQDIKTLYLLSFGIDGSINFIKNKYDTSLFYLKNIGVIAYDEKQQPAAYYGVFPITLNYNAKDYLVAQSGDTMTALEHRGKGLFIRLAKETYSLSQASEIKLIFGFPNENSYPGFKDKLNWVFYGCMKKFTINSKSFPLCELASKYKFLEPLYKIFVRNRISKYIINAQETNINTFDICHVSGQIKKDLPFFKYKLNNEMCSLINVEGFNLLVKTETHLIIGAVGYIEKSQTEKLLITIKKLSRRLGCAKIIFTLSKNHWLYDYLSEKIKPTDSVPIGFYLFNDEINPQEIQFTAADYDTF